MGPYRIIVADPPWRFGDRLPGPKRGAAKHYDVMALPDIEAHLPLLVQAREVTLTADAVLFMWRVAAMVPEAYRVVEAWGFEAKSEIVWSKQPRSGGRAFGMGHYVRMAHEACIIARRVGSRVPHRRALTSAASSTLAWDGIRPSRTASSTSSSVCTRGRTWNCSRGAIAPAGGALETSCRRPRPKKPRPKNLPSPRGPIRREIRPVSRGRPGSVLAGH